MSRTRCIIKNNSGHDLVVAEPGGSLERYRGTDWGDTVLKEGTKIPNGSEIEVGSIEDPGPTNRWGWIYFYSGAKASYIQLYIMSPRKGNRLASLGYYDQNSSEQDPQPSGVVLGEATYDSHTNIMIYNFTCTQTICTIKNESGFDLIVDVPEGAANYIRGPGHWNWGIEKGTNISAGAEMIVGIIGNPNLNERDYYGWIYFYSTAKKAFIQLYIKTTDKAGAYEYSLGYYDKDSSKENPQPHGILGSPVYDSSTKTVTYNFSCTQTKCIIRNESGEDLEVRIPIVDGMQFKGEQMLGVSAIGTKISHSEEREVGSIGNPDKSEKDFSGWIYFIARSKNKFIQLYIKSSKDKDGYSGSIGYYDKDSSEENPQPHGILSSATFDQTTNVARYTFT